MDYSTASQVADSANSRPSAGFEADYRALTAGAGYRVMADRIVVLNQGRVEQLGSPLELYQHPATLFVAGFIGAPKMNFLDAEVNAVGNQTLTLTLANGVSLAVPTPFEKLSQGEKLKLGVRAEHAMLEPEVAPGFSPAEGVLQGEVDALEHLGPTSPLRHASGMLPPAF